MERNPKIVVVVLGVLAWLPTGAIGFAADPFGGAMQFAGSMFGAWIVVSCVLKISVWLRAKRGVVEENEG